MLLSGAEAGPSGDRKHLRLEFIATLYTLMLTIMIIAQPSLQPQYLARRAQIIKKCNFNKSTLILRLLSMNMYALLLVWAMKLILRLALVLSGQKHLRIIFKIYIFLLSRAEDARKNVVGNVREKVQLATHIILV